MINVLAINDNKSDIHIVSESLSKTSFTVCEVLTLSEGLKKLSSEKYDVILLDLELPDSSGLATLEAVVDFRPNIPIVVLTRDTNNSELAGINAVKLGAQDYFKKSDMQDSRTLTCVLRHAIERYNMTIELEKKAEQLVNSRTLFSTVISYAADGILLLSSGGTVKYVNLAAQKMFGRKRNELVGKQFEYPFRDTSVCRDILCDKKRGIYAEMRIAQIVYERNPMYVVSLRDITAKRELQDIQGLKNELERERNRLNMMFEVAAEGIVVMDRMANIIETNAAFKHILGIAEWHPLRGNFFDYIDKSQRHLVHFQLKKCYISGNVCNIERFNLACPNGEKVPCILNVSILRFNTDEPRLLAFVTNLTEQVKTEERLIRSETLAVVGTLAAGVAHEFNNILAVIRGHLDSLLLQPHIISKQVKDQLEVMMRMVERGSEITNNLMVFTKESSNGFKQVNLKKMVDECIQLLSKEFHADGIEYILNVPDDLDIYANFSQICQVMMNLLLNAKDAMLDSSPKRITISGGLENDDCWLTITDTGCGIKSENMRHLFSPFFSTKGEKAEEGTSQAKLRGTGLGLAVCHTIVTKHHSGSINAESNVGVGTTFRLKLPRYKGQLSGKDDESIQDVPLGRGERILVLDDEIELISIIGKVLQNGGYNVVITDDGYKALQEHNNQPFEVVIMDLKMPIMSGYTFLNGLRESQKMPKVIIMTGNPSLLRGDKEKIGVDDILIKPLRVKDIFQHIRRALDEDGCLSERNDHVDCDKSM